MDDNDTEEIDQECSISQKKEKFIKQIFNFLTWGIFFIGFFLTFWLIFFWKMRFIDHIVFLTSLWISVYIVIIFDSYFGEKDFKKYYLLKYSAYERRL